MLLLESFLLLLWMSLARCGGVDLRIEGGSFAVAKEFGGGEVRTYRYNATRNSIAGKYTMTVPLSDCEMNMSWFEKTGNRFSDSPHATYTISTYKVCLTDIYIVPQMLSQSNWPADCIFKANQTYEVYSANIDVQPMIHMIPSTFFDKELRMDVKFSYQNKTVLSGSFVFVFDRTEYYRSKTRHG